MIRGAPKGYKIENYPNNFNSWLVYKHIENYVLWMDGYSYGLLCYRCHNFDRYLHYFPDYFPSSLEYDNIPHNSLTIEISWDIFALLLIIINIISKKDAHEVVGAYAWFCGDFFFQAQTELIIDSP